MTTMNKTYHYGNGTTAEKIRIIAAEGKAVTNDGQTFWKSIDVDSIDGWYEVDDPEPVDDEVSESDIAEALEGVI